MHREGLTVLGELCEAAHFQALRNPELDFNQAMSLSGSGCSSLSHSFEGLALSRFLILSGKGALALGCVGLPKMPWRLKAELSVNFTRGD